MLFWKRLKKYNKEEAEKKADEIRQGGGLEKKDLPAMLLSAFLIFIPISCVVLGGICLLALWLFGLH